MSPQDMAKQIVIITRTREAKTPDGDMLLRMAKAYAIGMCESRGQADAVNRTPAGTSCNGPGAPYAAGYFQIVPRCHPVDGLDGRETNAYYLNGKANVERAYSISNGWRDWRLWACKAEPDDKAKRAITEAMGEKYDGGIIEDGVGGVIGGAGDLIDAATDPLSQIRDALAFITDGGNWMRVLYVAAGALFALLGLVFVGIDLSTPAVKSALGTPEGSPTTP